jgi:hypothetical protein
MGSGRSRNLNNQAYGGYQGFPPQTYCMPRQSQTPMILPIPIPYPMPMPMQMPMQQSIQYCCPMPTYCPPPQPVMQQRQCTSITYCC